MSESQPKYPELENLNVPELAKRQKELQNDIESRKKSTSVLQEELDHIRYTKIPNLMEDIGVTSMNVTGLGRVTVQPDMWTQTVDKDQMMVWLRDNNLQDLIKDNVNASTLKAEIKRRMKQGDEIPLEEVFKVTPYMRASVTAK